jgi:hypothetical protein
VPSRLVACPNVFKTHVSRGMLWCEKACESIC